VETEIKERSWPPPIWMVCSDDFMLRRHLEFFDFGGEVYSVPEPILTEGANADGYTARQISAVINFGFKAEEYPSAHDRTISPRILFFSYDITEDDFLYQSSEAIKRFDELAKPFGERLFIHHFEKV
jgi:hypothetical protein